jgi:transposase
MRETRMAKKKPETRMVPLRDIRIDGGTQPREEIDEDTVEAFRECLDRGDEFPPADVFHDGAATWLADGFHRWHAADRAGHEQMECNIHKGTKADAQWFAAGVNQTHGLRRSNADKAKAVRMALDHPNAEGKSDGQIAKHVGVSDRTVAKYRAELTPKLSESTKRTGRDGRTTDTSNIGGRGKKRKAKAKPKKPAKKITTSGPKHEAFVACQQIKVYADTIGRWLSQSPSIDDYRNQWPSAEGDRVVKAATELFEALKKWSRATK